MTQEQENLSEQLIEKIKDNNGAYDYRDFKPIWETENGMIRIVIIRTLKELLLIEDVNDTIIRLTSKGWIFEGFTLQREKIKLQIKKEHDKHILELKQLQSVIDTNNSVKKTNEFILENSKRQNNLTISSIIVAATSALFVLASIFVQSMDKTSKEAEQIKQQLKKQLQIEEQMQKSQKGIDSSLKKYLERPNRDSL